ncbi:hypothetical protein QQS21_009127 [Conoideocrella luteorostrata]|uniref:Uncharacterized protein n=1 Tax=Conoideocrella luteorostrata TaxID=1105319 RepID=A0AAJ0CHS1_9HYPO|nr:hypothetical protein QQS21_009127 [Conoideocrella luteorostrata]
MATMQPILLQRLNRDGLRPPTSNARAGKWPSVRTLPNQFHPRNIDNPNPAAEGIWGTQAVTHPDMPFQQEFIKTYFSKAIISPLLELLQCSKDHLVMELFNLLVRPDYDFELRWHKG